jgi:hypothetical protein
MKVCSLHGTTTYLVALFRQMTKLLWEKIVHLSVTMAGMACRPILNASKWKE